MKSLKTWVLLISLLVWASVGMKGVLLGQEVTPDQDAMQKKWVESMTPGANHKYLENFVGQWNAVVNTWMQPGAEPMVSNCDVNAEMILGGRYLHFTMKGTMMGMPFEGVNITGYNNYKKEFFSLWIDNMSTMCADSYGSLDATGKIKTETGLWDDPMAGTKMKVKTVDTMVDQDKHIFDMFMVMPDGSEFRSMSIVYTRKK